MESRGGRGLRAGGESCIYEGKDGMMAFGGRLYIA
jgi:hypothetical protein